MSFQFSPLNEDQLKQLRNLHSSLNDNQLFWLAGYLAGALNSTVSNQISNPILKTELTILYGSRTGNGEGIAKIIAEKATVSGLEVKLVNLTKFKVRDIESVRNLLLIVSTHGEGEPPFEAKEFYDFLHGKRAPKLNNLNFSVLGLGDSSYVNFCQTAKDFNMKFEQLGGKQIQEAIYLDIDYKSKYNEWTESLLTNISPNAESNLKLSDVIRVSENSEVYTAENPFKAKLLDKIQLYGRGSERKVYHLELLTDGLNYQAGDALGVLPVNNDNSVRLLLQLFKLESNSMVNRNGLQLSIHDALKYKFEIQKLTPDVLKRYLTVFPDKNLQTLVDNPSDLISYLNKKSLPDFWTDFPQIPTADELVEILRPLQPRLYSISSSNNYFPGEVHLTVGLVEFELSGKEIKGVCSDYLASLDEDAEINVFIERNDNFRLPADLSKNIIMIGAGTGIAPFRAFVQEREFQNASGKNWLFFGNRNFETEFLYQNEWIDSLDSGKLTKLDLAFSRDGVDKLYVQHKLIENASEVFKWIQEGAFIYVCGDKSKLAGDVQNAVLRILKEQGELNDEDAETYLLQLIKDKRYQTDVY